MTAPHNPCDGALAPCDGTPFTTGAHRSPTGAYRKPQEPTGAYRDPPAPSLSNPLPHEKKITSAKVRVLNFRGGSWWNHRPAAATRSLLTWHGAPAPGTRELSRIRSGAG